MDLDPLDPDLHEALLRKFDHDAMVLIPLKSGRLAVFDRRNNLRTIWTELPSLSEIHDLTIAWGQAVRHEMAVALESHFLGEPTSRELARDLRRAHSTSIPRPRSAPVDLSNIELEL